MKDITLNIVYSHASLLPTQPISQGQLIISVFSNEKEFSKYELRKIYDELYENNEEDKEFLFFSEPAELGHFAEILCQRNHAKEAMLISTHDYNAALATVNNTSNYRSIFNRYGKCVTNSQINNNNFLSFWKKN